jgi:hypothetical protein
VFCFPLVDTRPRMLRRAAMLLEHLQTQLMPRSIASSLRHSGCLATLSIRRPLFGKIQPSIHQSVFVTRHVSHVDRHLAVVDFAQAATPLPSHTDRLTS